MREEDLYDKIRKAIIQKSQQPYGMMQQQPQYPMNYNMGQQGQNYGNQRGGRPPFNKFKKS